MTDVYALLYATLSSLGYPVREQGTFDPDKKLPDTLLSYQLIDSPNTSFADNRPTSQTSRFQLCLYSRKPAIKQQADRLIQSVMLPAGFLRVAGRDLPFDKITGHYGYTCDYRYYDHE